MATSALPQPPRSRDEEREVERLDLQRKLDAERTAEERNRLGQFATPSPLASEIARYVLARWGDAPIDFLDPAIGSGSFYSALARAAPQGLVRSARGVELDERFARTAERLFSDSGLMVTHHDFTILAPTPEWRASLVLTNPPYVRHHHLKEAKARLNAAATEVLGHPISGLAGLYVYFLILAHRWMAPRALGVWLIPSEFMDVNYGAAVKEYLTRRVTLRHIHRFDPADVQFDDALVSSAIIVFENRPPERNDQASFTFGGTLTSPRLKADVALDTLRGLRKWSILPERETHEAPGATEPGVSLSSLIAVKRGLATGDNGFFILPRDGARALGIPDEALKPMLPSPRHLKASVVEREADGYPAIDSKLALIDTDMPEARIRHEYPEFWAYLESGIARGVKNAYLVKGRDPWYSQEKRAPPPFVCTYMGRSDSDENPFRFIRNKSDALATNSFLLLYPKGILKDALDGNPALYDNLHEALNALTGAAIKAEGRVYGGGLHKVEPKELGRLDATPILEALHLKPPLTVQRSL